MRYPFIFGRILILPVVGLLFFVIYFIARRPEEWIGGSILLILLTITLLLNIRLIRKDNTGSHIREKVEHTSKNNLDTGEALSMPLDKTLNRLQYFSIGSYIGTIIFSLILWFIFGVSIINALTTIFAVRLIGYIAAFAAISGIVFIAFNADALRARPLLKVLKSKVPVLTLTSKGMDVPFVLLNELDWYNEELRSSVPQSVHVDWEDIIKWQVIRGYRSIKPQYALTLNKKIHPLNRDTLSICSMDFSDDQKQNILSFAQRFLQIPMKWF